LLEIDLKILLRKTGARLISKIELISLHIDPDLVVLITTKIVKKRKNIAIFCHEVKVENSKESCFYISALELV
jgi:hypothetical protein